MERKPIIVLEGAWSDCAARWELRILLNFALAGKFRLVLLDLGEPRDTRELAWEDETWSIQETLSGSPGSDLIYIDKTMSDWKDKVKELGSARYVHVVSPNSTHKEVIEFWSSRLEPDGLIVCQKPLAEAPSEADRLVEFLKMQGTADRVFMVDHQLVKASPFLSDPIWREKIGKIKAINLAILEAHSITPWRTKNLDSGMLVDLGCHVFLWAGAVASRQTNPLLKTMRSLRLLSVKAAQYGLARIRGDTFAAVEAVIEADEAEIPVRFEIGKGIGGSDDKFIEVIGERGVARANFVKNRYGVRLGADGTYQEFGKPVSNHMETFLGAILAPVISGNPDKFVPSSIPGCLDLGVAAETVRLVSKAQKMAGPLTAYVAGDIPNGRLGYVGITDLARAGYTARKAAAVPLRIEDLGRMSS